MDSTKCDLARNRSSIPLWSKYQHKSVFYEAVTLKHMLQPDEETLWAVSYVIDEMKRFIKQIGRTTSGRSGSCFQVAWTPLCPGGVLQKGNGGGKGKTCRSQGFRIRTVVFEKLISFLISIHLFATLLCRQNVASHRFRARDQTLKREEPFLATERDERSFSMIS